MLFTPYPRDALVALVDRNRYDDPATLRQGHERALQILAQKLREAGLGVEIIAWLDYFSGSVSADTRRAAKALGAHAIMLRGVRRA